MVPDGYMYVELVDVEDELINFMCKEFERDIKKLDNGLFQYKWSNYSVWNCTKVNAYKIIIAHHIKRIYLSNDFGMIPDNAFRDELHLIYISAPAVERIGLCAFYNTPHLSIFATFSTRLCIEPDAFVNSAKTLYVPCIIGITHGDVPWEKDVDFILHGTYIDEFYGINMICEVAKSVCVIDKIDEDGIIQPM